MFFFSCKIIGWVGTSNVRSFEFSAMQNRIEIRWFAFRAGFFSSCVCIHLSEKYAPIRAQLKNRLSSNPTICYSFRIVLRLTFQTIQKHFSRPKTASVSPNRGALWRWILFSLKISQHTHTQCECISNYLQIQICLHFKIVCIGCEFWPQCDF